jgi:hypothetical protein
VAIEREVGVPYEVGVPLVEERLIEVERVVERPVYIEVPVERRVEVPVEVEKVVERPVYYEVRPTDAVPPDRAAPTPPAHLHTSAAPHMDMDMAETPSANLPPVQVQVPVEVEVERRVEVPYYVEAPWRERERFERDRLEFDRFGSPRTQPRARHRSAYMPPYPHEHDYPPRPHAHPRMGLPPPEAVRRYYESTGHPSRRYRPGGPPEIGAAWRDAHSREQCSVQ